MGMMLMILLARQGRGIFLTSTLERVALGEPQVAQVYIHRPLLLDGFKFDIRMYVLVTSCCPLRMYKVRRPGLHDHHTMTADAIDIYQ
jgi:hypothetical protein